MTYSLTDQPVAKSLLRFSIPITVGGILSQMYSFADAIIVGRFAGVNALAAVGAGFPIILLLVAIMTGIGAGSEILIARCLGKEDLRAAKRTQDSLLTLILLLTCVITITGVVFSKSLLKLVSTPLALLEDSTAYLRIYFFGLLGIAGYNTLAGMIRSTGNSWMPTVLLAGCCLLNILLDLCFVGVFNMGVRGAALATTIAQTVSFVACLRYINTRQGFIPYRLTNLDIDLQSIRDGLRLGLPLTAQRAITGVAMALFQSMVNGLGVPVITAFTLGSRIDSFAAMPVIGIGQAVCVFASQNNGAGRNERVKEAQKLGLLWCSIFAAVLLVLFWTSGEWICGLFIDDAQVIRYGWDYIRILSATYFFTCYSEVMQGVIRGMGNTIVPTMSSIIGLFAVRLPLAWLLAGTLGYIGVWLSIPVGWIASYMITLAYVKSDRYKRRLFELSGKAVT